MCDTISTLQTSFFLAVLSLFPNNINGYVTLGLTLLVSAVYAIHRASPTTRLARLEEAIRKTEDILDRAMNDCARDMVDLMDGRNRLRR
jgi:hypothetical protein